MAASFLKLWTIEHRDDGEVLVAAPSGNTMHVTDRGNLAERILWELGVALAGAEGAAGVGVVHHQVKAQDTPLDPASPAVAPPGACRGLVVGCSKAAGLPCDCGRFKA